MLKHVMDKVKLNNVISVIDTFFEFILFKNKIDKGIKIYEADPNALNNITVGRTLAEARALGPIVTPRQYPCTYCVTGACAIVVNVVQCNCGTTQCPPTATAPSMIYLLCFC
jgi:hypothetical protein